MYGIYLRWEMDANGTWFYEIGEIKVEGFVFESGVIRAGLSHLKELEKKKMDELQTELNDVNRSIEQLLLAPQHIEEINPEQDTLNVLLGRHAEIVDLLDYPPREERNKDFD